ncbi:hypothetical protein [Burkholderia sp. SIMBA_062]|uniref:hypothetical protein n=1 Tax=Burkholderia sp. SIMBA_062 TaxID=3085803 RepID=UPI00397D9461
MPDAIAGAPLPARYFLFHSFAVVGKRLRAAFVVASAFAVIDRVVPARRTGRGCEGHEPCL